ncbi:hypothetical protein B0E53_00071 [Micromonospora sp. MH33]|nr:hypothetical protein B0E53_00071 [Micromonospora sp. MH33]
MRFSDYPFMAKLARWGVDIHMGVLFGLPNQIALAGLATGLVVMVVLGYRMWWQRRPTTAARWRPGPAVRRGGLRALPWPGLAAVAVVAINLQAVALRCRGAACRDVASRDRPGLGYSRCLRCWSSPAWLAAVRKAL